MVATVRTICYEMEKHEIQESTPALLCIPRTLLSTLWPPERRIQGLRVCRALRLDLTHLGGSVTLHGKHCDFAEGRRALTSPFEQINTFRMFDSLPISVVWKGVDQDRLHDLMVGIDATHIHSQITSLTLSGDIGDGSTYSLGPILAQMTRLTLLDLGDEYRVRAGRTCEWWAPNATLNGEADPDRNSIGAIGIRNFTASVSHITGLQHLSLLHHSLGPESTHIFSEGLRLWPTLRSLNLGGNELRDEGLATLAPALPHTLTDLCISHNALDTQGVRVLAHTIPNLSLTRLDLRANYCLSQWTTAETLATAMSRCSSLRHLALDNTGISDAGLETLTVGWNARGTLKELHVGGNELTSVGIRRLATLIGSCALDYTPSGGQPTGRQGSRSVGTVATTHLPFTHSSSLECHEWYGAQLHEP